MTRHVITLLIVLCVLGQGDFAWSTPYRANLCSTVLTAAETDRLDEELYLIVSTPAFLEAVRATLVQRLGIRPEHVPLALNYFRHISHTEQLRFLEALKDEISTRLPILYTWDDIAQYGAQALERAGVSDIAVYDVLSAAWKKWSNNADKQDQLATFLKMRVLELEQIDHGSPVGNQPGTLAVPQRTSHSWQGLVDRWRGRWRALILAIKSRLGPTGLHTHGIIEPPSIPPTPTARTYGLPEMQADIPRLEAEIAFIEKRLQYLDGEIRNKLSAFRAAFAAVAEIDRTWDINSVFIQSPQGLRKRILEILSNYKPFLNSTEYLRLARRCSNSFVAQISNAKYRDSKHRALRRFAEDLYTLTQDVPIVTAEHRVELSALLELLSASALERLSHRDYRAAWYAANQHLNDLGTRIWGDHQAAPRIPRTYWADPRILKPLHDGPVSKPM